MIWGTDNGPALQAAATACPTNIGFPPVGISFTSKGCVLMVPNPGSSGTADYMFTTGAALTTETSFQIVGMGNSSKNSTLLTGVRFITAAPIVILTVGSNGDSAFNNLGGFQISNIGFADVSNNGSALGGLDMIQVSAAIIAYCDFEDFNGQIADPSNDGTLTIPNISAFGMKSDPGTMGTTNNNIVLLHDKGTDNMVWYDSSLVPQDGPIVIGGDIFPVTSNTTTTSGACYGIIAEGPIRLYGTHFDSGTNTDGTSCYGVKILQGGIISAKFESSAGQGSGALLQGGDNRSNLTGITLTRSTNTKYVTVSLTSNNFVAGQLVRIKSCPSDHSFEGTFIVTSPATSPSNSFTYDFSGATTLNSTTCDIVGITASGVEVDAILANIPLGVDVKSGSQNNKITALVNGLAVTTPVSDSSTNNDIVQVLTSVSPGPSTKISGTFSPAGAGGVDLGTTSLPFANLWLGSSATNNIKITQAATGARVLTLPDATDTLVGKTTTDTLTHKTLQGTNSANSVNLLNYQKSAAAVNGTGAGNFVNVYTFSISGQTLAAGKCIHAVVGFQHTTGTASVTYRWFVGNTASTTFAAPSSTLAFDDFYFCNDPGQTAANALIVRPASFGGNWQPGGIVTNGTENTMNSLSLSFQFSVANTDAVTPEMFEVLLDQ